MKIELLKNKVFLDNRGLKKEIHPFWLRERVNGDIYVDKSTQQRLFDPTELKSEIEIKSLNLSKDYLEITFNDGVYTKFAIRNIFKEFSNNNLITDIKKIKWNSSLKEFNHFKFKKNYSLSISKKKQHSTEACVGRRLFHPNFKFQFSLKNMEMV